MQARSICAWVLATGVCAANTGVLPTDVGSQKNAWRLECSRRYHLHTASFEAERRLVVALKPNRTQVNAGTRYYWNGLIFWPAAKGNEQLRFSFVARLEPSDESEGWTVRELGPSLTSFIKSSASAKAILEVDRRYAGRARDPTHEARILNALKQAANECIELAH
jgi:hypothetical protein